MQRANERLQLLQATARTMPAAAHHDLMTYWARRRFEGRASDLT